MIKILDSAFKRQAILKTVINSERFEELNGANTLSLETVIDKKTDAYLNENSVLELDTDYFDIAYLEKSKNEDETSMINANAEHISYRLNNPEYDVEEFTETGSPAVIFAKILSGTGFTSAGIDVTTNVTISIQEKKSRRQLLMEFAAICDAELMFYRFTVKLLKKRGSRDIKLFTDGKNISVVSKIVDKGERDELGNPKIAYTCTSSILDNSSINIGDDILLIQSELGIRENLRVVSYSYNPYNKRSTILEIGNFVSDLADTIYNIETGTVAKENLYNGCKIGPDEGFVAEARNKNDPTKYVFAKTVMNATDGISIYSSTGDNKSLERNFYVDTDGTIQAKGLYISGESTFRGLVTAAEIEVSNFTGGTINASSFVGGSIKIGPTDGGYYNYNFEVDSGGNLFARSGYFEGNISGSTITGSNINVNTSVSIGDWLSIGGGTSWQTAKGITIFHGGNRSEIQVDSNGLFGIYNWGAIDIETVNNLTLHAYEDITLNGWNVILAGADSYVDSVHPDNIIARALDIDELWAEINDLWAAI